MAYQVDFFPVGEGSKSGDAIAMRFGDFSDYLKTQIVVMDGGFQSSGEALVKHIREMYGTTYVDLIVQNLRALREEMKAVARGERPAPADAGKPSFNSVQAVVDVLFAGMLSDSKEGSP